MWLLKSLALRSPLLPLLPKTGAPKVPTRARSGSSAPTAAPSRLRQRAKATGGERSAEEGEREGAVRHYNG